MLAACLLLFALAIGAVGIDRPMFIDEANSILIASHDLRGLIDHLARDNNLPLYYFFLHGWIRWFGVTEVATRAPSVCFYFLGIFTVYKLGERLSGNSRIGLYAAFFYGASLQAVHLAQKVRMYSLLGFLAAGSTLLFFRCFWKGESRRRDWILYSLINVAGSFTHVWFFFLLFAQLVCYLIFFPRVTLRKVLASLVLSGIPFLFLWGRILSQQMRNGATDWMPVVDFWTGLFAIFEFYGGMKIGAVFLLACGLLLLMRERGEPRTVGEGETRAQWALLSIFVLSLGVPLAVSVFKPIYWPGRYTIIALPSLSLLLAWRLAATVWRPALAVFAGIVLACVLGLHIESRHDMIENSGVVVSYADSDQHAAEELMKRVQPGDSLIFTGLSRASIQYYSVLYHRDMGANWISFPAENADHLGWDNDRISRADLDAEAKEVSAQLTQSGAANARRIWILVGKNKMANDALFSEMDRRFSRLGDLNARGALFSTVAIYQNMPLKSSNPN